MTSILDERKLFFLSVILIFSLSFVSAEQSFVYPDQSSGQSFESQDWFEAPTWDSQQELIYQILAPFAFVTILLQFSLKKALRMTFAQDDNTNPFTGANKPKVHKESTAMALAISGMLLASPYWPLIRQMAASIGILSVAMVILIMLYIGYLFLSG